MCEQRCANDQHNAPRTSSSTPAIWLDDPRDQLSHAWRYVEAGGAWRALCGLVADPATLTEPEDEFGRHLACELKLGEEIAGRLGKGVEWRE